MCRTLIVKVEDMGLSAQDRRFALLINRFDWTGDAARGKGARKRAALRFEHVTHARTMGF